MRNLVIFLLVFWCTSGSLVFSIHPHVDMTSPEIIRDRGYPAEVHNVTTEDGYILEMHRIPKGQNQCKHISVVFIQHGFISSSAEYILNDPDQALAFVLADACFDVWLGNFRGNRYSQRHTSLDPEDPEFWDFSINEFAKYDVPSMLRYVKAKTEAKNISYVGHSLGCGAFFAMMTYHPDINEWINVMGAMAPAAHIHNARVFKRFGSLMHVVEKHYLKRNKVAFRLNKSVFTKIVNYLCSPKRFTAVLCDFVRMLIYGDRDKYTDKEYRQVINAHSPDATSANVARHLFQFYKRKDFEAFDYGAKMNLEKYGTKEPPPFLLEEVTAPVGVFWSDGDYFVDPLDVNQTISELGNVVFNYRVALEDFKHNDFLWAENANEVVYDSLLDMLNDYR